MSVLIRGKNSPSRSLGDGTDQSGTNLSWDLNLYTQSTEVIFARRDLRLPAICNRTNAVQHYIVSSPLQRHHTNTLSYSRFLFLFVHYRKTEKSEKIWTSGSLFDKCTVSAATACGRNHPHTRWKRLHDFAGNATVLPAQLCSSWLPHVRAVLSACSSYCVGPSPQLASLKPVV